MTNDRCTFRNSMSLLEVHILNKGFEKSLRWAVHERHFWASACNWTMVLDKIARCQQSDKLPVPLLCVRFPVHLRSEDNHISFHITCWLTSRDPYNGLLYSPENWIV